MQTNLIANDMEVGPDKSLVHTHTEWKAPYLSSFQPHQTLSRYRNPKHIITIKHSPTLALALPWSLSLQQEQQQLSHAQEL